MKSTLIQSSILIWLSISTLISCTSGKEPFPEQFAVVENKIVYDSAFIQSSSSQFFTFGVNKVGVFLSRSKSSSYADEDYEVGRFFVSYDVSTGEFKGKRLASVVEGPDPICLYGNSPCIIIMYRDFDEIKIERSDDDGQTWRPFFHTLRYDEISTQFTLDFSENDLHCLMFDCEFGTFIANDTPGVELFRFGNSNFLQAYNLIEGYRTTDVSFPDASLGWMLCESKSVQGYNGDAYLFKTIDGGITWSDSILVSLTSTYRQMLALSESIIILIKNGEIHLSLDEGKTWQLRKEDFNSRVFSANDGHLYAFDNKGTGYEYDYYLFRSVDYGMTWVSTSEMEFGSMDEVSIDNYGQCLAKSNEGDLILSSDYGNTWQILSILSR